MSNDTITKDMLSSGSTGIGGAISIKKRGGVATMLIWGYQITGSEPARPEEPSNTIRIVIGTIPEGFKPATRTAILFPNQFNNVYGYIEGNQIWIQKNNISTGAVLYGSCTYTLA